MAGGRLYSKPIPYRILKVEENKERTSVHGYLKHYPMNLKFKAYQPKKCFTAFGKGEWIADRPIGGRNG